MRGLFRRLVLAGLVLAVVLPAAAASDRITGGDRGVVFGMHENGLLVPGQPLAVDVPGAAGGVELWFTPDTTTDSRGVSVLVGIDRNGTAPSFGPDCGAGCVVHDEYVFDPATLRRALPVDESPGTLSVRRVGDTADAASLHVYWDATPPVARFRTPRFNARPGRDGWRIVAHSLDQNLASIVVTWGPGVPHRFTPLYEQHTLGYTLGNDGHASCAPTSAMAAMDWLSQGGASLPGLIPSSVCGNDKVCWVGLMGLAMGTTGAAGTSGAGLEQGLNLWLDASGYTGSIDHQGGVMTPEQMVQLANAPGATILGIHSVSPDTGFGHVVVLDNAVPGPNGTAIVTIMDVNQEPNPGGAMQGAYRSFVMHPGGWIAWSSAYTTYYDPPSGKLQFDEYAHVEAYLFSNSFFASRLLKQARTAGGVVLGELRPGGHRWVGRFTPPAGERGPFLLTTIATDTAGNVQRDYQYVGGPKELRRDDDPSDSASDG